MQFYIDFFMQKKEQKLKISQKSFIEVNQAD